ncbi:MAG: helix-turn-helix domain-containing protein [Terriglobia bacterium]
MARSTFARRRSGATSAGKGKEHGPDPIAARLRSIRRHKGVTLERLSSLSGLDRGYLSRIERGHKTPSLAALLSIGKALDVQMAHLFGETVGSSPITVVRQAQYKDFPGARRGHEHFAMIMPQSEARRLSLVMVSLDSTPTPAGVEHAGEEIVFVLDGEIEVSFVDRKVDLAQGDCVHFDGHLKHAIRRIGNRAARALIIVGESPRS